MPKTWFSEEVIIGGIEKEQSQTMFKSRSEGNVVYKCTVRLLEDLDVLECEFQVMIGGALD